MYGQEQGQDQRLRIIHITKVMESTYEYTFFLKKIGTMNPHFLCYYFHYYYYYYGDNGGINKTKSKVQIAYRLIAPLGTFYMGLQSVNFFFFEVNSFIIESM
jgi:hypothetical protein